MGKQFLADSWAFGGPYRPVVTKRTKASSVLIALTAFFTLAMGAVAMADNTVSDGDGVTPLANNDLAFGTICAGEDASRTVPVWVNRNGAAGSTNVFKDGSSVTITVNSVTGSGLMAVMGSPNTITLPANWGSLANNTDSASVSAMITLNTSTVGAFSGSVVFRGSGLNSSNVGINRDDAMSVTANVEDCTPADTTAPDISYVLNPASPDGDNGWYQSNVTLTWTVSEPESSGSLVKTGCVDQNITADQTATTYSCSATSDGGSAGPVNVSIKRDATPPTITDGGPTTTPDGNNGWYISAVSNSFAASDATSGLADCAATFTKSSGAAEGSAVKVNSGSCSDNAGNTINGIDSAAFQIDLSNPTVTCSAAPNFILNQPGAEVSASVSDSVSGAAASPVTASVNTSSVGTFTQSLTGYDNAGRSTTVGCSYTVGYNFDGFFQPIDNTLANSAKAGQSVPVKWRLTDYFGVGVSDPASFRTVASVAGSGACSGLPVDAIETYAGSSGLQYLGDGYWQFNWQTPKAYAGQCRTMKLYLNDGTASGAAYKTASFLFK